MGSMEDLDALAASALQDLIDAVVLRDRERAIVCARVFASYLKRGAGMPEFATEDEDDEEPTNPEWNVQ